MEGITREHKRIHLFRNPKRPDVLLGEANRTDSGDSSEKALSITSTPCAKTSACSRPLPDRSVNKAVDAI